MTDRPPDFSKIKIRVAALICHDGHVLALRKNDVYTLPGGNVEDGEDILAALWRELAEETGLTPAHFNSTPVLCDVQDHMVNRPGATPAPRKLHFVFRLAMPARGNITAIDVVENGTAIWIALDQLCTSHCYPPASSAWHDGGGYVDLGIYNDQTYQWRTS